MSCVSRLVTAVDAISQQLSEPGILRINGKGFLGRLYITENYSGWSEHSRPVFSPSTGTLCGPCSPPTWGHGVGQHCPIT